ncbi:MAG: protein TolA, partial [Hyphomicrobiaceae bacterium]
PDPEGPTPAEQAAAAAKLDAERKAAAAAAAAKAKADKAKADKAKADKAKADKAKADKAKADKERQQAERFAKIQDLLKNTPDDSPPKANTTHEKSGVVKPTGKSDTAQNLGPSAGTRDGRDNVLSATEKDMLNNMLDAQLKPHWRLPAAGGGTETPLVTVTWRLNADGMLNGEPAVQRAQNNTQFQLAAEAAIRAIKSAQPFKLPADKYAFWRDNSWTFDPSKML